MTEYNYLPESLVLRPTLPANEGVFVLHKSMFIVDGKNVPRTYRCDNLSYNVEVPVHGTAYEDEGIYVGAKSKWDDFYLGAYNIYDWAVVLDFTPYFCFTYFKFVHRNADSAGHEYAADMHHSNSPAILWGGKTLIELLKNMREWTFMLDEPFNSDHPMATYSKLAFDKLETPQWVFDELDAFPDMHLARFLKGDEDHRNSQIELPQMSDDMRDWLKEKLLENPFKETNDRLRELEI
jgi:hypothetical protein